MANATYYLWWNQFDTDFVCVEHLTFIDVVPDDEEWGEIDARDGRWRKNVDDAYARFSAGGDNFPKTGSIVDEKTKVGLDLFSGIWIVTSRTGRPEDLFPVEEWAIHLDKETKKRRRKHLVAT